MKKKLVLTAIIGNILEYYDFTIYSVFAIQISQTFFSSSDHISKILLSLAVFALSSFIRPFGGIIFGHLGDRLGRKISLTTSMVGMAVPTFLIAITPDYHAIGIFAPILLICFRILQGICISGEGANAAIFMLEHFSKWRPGFISSVVMASNTIGALLATIVGVLISKSDLLNWRAAFVFGGILGATGVYLRLKVRDTPEFEALKRQNKILKYPLINIFKTNIRGIILCACIGGTTSSFSYFVKTYLNILFANYLGYDQEMALNYVAFSTSLLIIFIPFFGYLADIIGYKKVITYASYISVITIIPTIMLMERSNNIVVLLSLVIVALLTSAMSAPAYIYSAILFSPEQRVSGVSFSYNLGIACLGGVSPFIFTYLNNITHLNYAAGFYIIFVSILFLVIQKTIKV